MYHAKVGGVFSIEPSFAIAAKSMNAGVAGARATEQIFAHDHEREAGRTDVLLRAGVDQAELRHVDRPRQDRRGHVGDQRHGAGVRHEMKLDAADRLVRRVVQVRGVRRALPARDRRNRRVRLAGIGGDVHAARSASLRRSPSSTTRRCSRSRRRSRASSGSAARPRTARWRRPAGTAPCSSSAPPAARADRPRPARRSTTNALPRWLISITDMPVPCQSSSSSRACSRTSSGRTAGPGLKLKTRMCESDRIVNW